MNNKNKIFRPRIYNLEKKCIQTVMSVNYTGKFVINGNRVRIYFKDLIFINDLGRKDYLNKKLYEGDIVDIYEHSFWSDNNNWKIYRRGYLKLDENGNIVFIEKLKNSKEVKKIDLSPVNLITMLEPFDSYSYVLVKIGNIYSNPELLDEKIDHNKLLCEYLKEKKEQKNDKI